MFLGITVKTGITGKTGQTQWLQGLEKIDRARNGQKQNSVFPVFTFYPPRPEAGFFCDPSRLGGHIQGEQTGVFFTLLFGPELPIVVLGTAMRLQNSPGGFSADAVFAVHLLEDPTLIEWS